MVTYRIQPVNSVNSVGAVDWLLNSAVDRCQMARYNYRNPIKNPGWPTGVKKDPKKVPCISYGDLPPGRWAETPTT